MKCAKWSSSFFIQKKVSRELPITSSMALHGFRLRCVRENGKRPHITVKGARRAHAGVCARRVEPHHRLHLEWPSLKPTKGIIQSRNQRDTRGNQTLRTLALLPVPRFGLCSPFRVFSPISWSVQRTDRPNPASRPAKATGNSRDLPRINNVLQWAPIFDRIKRTHEIAPTTGRPPAELGRLHSPDPPGTPPHLGAGQQTG